jgi:diaminohydroxyphosphoribosylaminopyrimidine deaminase / 5-amino-6-(5-phosphoribosylamino)uracil reductase
MQLVESAYESAVQWMRRALDLAARGTALASPNPMVGAVLVRDGRVVGEGFHTYDGRKHAEIIAIEHAGEQARGATLYINLEPCCHQGRTGPCTEAVIKAGISGVVASMPDPNPAVSGKGFEQLRAASIRVDVGLCRDDAERLNEAFACYIRTKRPLVTLKTAMTLDGKIAAPDDNTGGVTSEEARAEVQRQRHAHDAIWTGIGTVLADDPLLTDRTSLPRRRALLRVLTDSQLRIPLAARMLDSVGNDLLILCNAGADLGKWRALEKRGAQVCSMPGDGRPDPRLVVAELGRREITSVLLEAGAELNGAALEAGIVDKVFFYYAPKILAGRDALPMAAGRGIRAMRDAIPVRNIRHHQFGDDFAVEGYLHDVYGNQSEPG